MANFDNLENPGQLNALAEMFVGRRKAILDKMANLAEAKMQAADTIESACASFDEREAEIVARNAKADERLAKLGVNPAELSQTVPVANSTRLLDWVHVNDVPDWTVAEDCLVMTFQVNKGTAKERLVSYKGAKSKGRRLALRGSGMYIPTSYVDKRPNSDPPRPYIHATIVAGNLDMNGKPSRAIQVLGIDPNADARKIKLANGTEILFKQEVSVWLRLSRDQAEKLEDAVREHGDNWSNNSLHIVCKVALYANDSWRQKDAAAEMMAEGISQVDGERVYNGTTYEKWSLAGELLDFCLVARGDELWAGEAGRRGVAGNTIMQMMSPTELLPKRRSVAIDRVMANRYVADYAGRLSGSTPVKTKPTAGSLEASIAEESEVSREA